MTTYYTADADTLCRSCASERFAYRCEHDDPAATAVPLAERRPGVRYSADCPLLNTDGIPYGDDGALLPVDTEGERIYEANSWDDGWCNEDSEGCLLSCGQCGRDIAQHDPSRHGYCDCRDGCQDGQCYDDCDNEPECDDCGSMSHETGDCDDGGDSNEPSYGCSCEACEAGAAYVLGVDDTEQVEQMALPVEDAYVEQFGGDRTIEDGMADGDQGSPEADAAIRAECERPRGIPGSETACSLPGYNEGPSLTGGPDQSYYCERAPGHSGDHAWHRWGPDTIVRWAVR